MFLSTCNFSFESAWKTDVGCVRRINEDTVFVDEKMCMWFVADGMGGHAAGDFASQTIANQLDNVGIPTCVEDWKGRFQHRLSTANEMIRNYASQNDLGTIGSTVAGISAVGDKICCVWSGDSRVYRFRDGQLQMLSRDHTEVQELLDNGSISLAQAENWPRKNVITKAIGVSPNIEYDCVVEMLADQDRFLICSDGLTEYFSDGELQVAFSGSETDLSPMCNTLVNAAMNRGGKDNISVVLIRAKIDSVSETEVSGIYPEYSSLL